MSDKFEPMELPNALVPSRMGISPVPISKPAESTDLIIESSSLLQESIDSFSTTIEDMDSVSANALDDLFKLHFISKQDVSDAIIEALSRNTSQVRENSFLVRNQLRAAELEERERLRRRNEGLDDEDSESTETSDFEEIFKSAGGSSGKGLADTYNEIVREANNALKNPLSLVDKVAELPFKALDSFRNRRSKSSRKTTEQTRRSSTFYETSGSLDSGMPVREGVSEDFYGSSFSGIFPFADSSKQQDAVFQESLLSSVLGEESDPLTSEDNIEEEAAITGMKADNVMFDTFDDPEKSSFGSFLGDQMKERDAIDDAEDKLNFLNVLFQALMVGGFLLLLPMIPNMIKVFTEDIKPFIDNIVGIFAPLVDSIATITFSTASQWFESIGALFRGEISLLSFLVGENSLQRILADTIISYLGIEGVAANIITNAATFGVPAAILGAAAGRFIPGLRLLPPGVNALLFGVAATLSATGIQSLRRFLGGGPVDFTDLDTAWNEGGDAFRDDMSDEELWEFIRRRSPHPNTVFHLLGNDPGGLHSALVDRFSIFPMMFSYDRAMAALNSSDFNEDAPFFQAYQNALSEVYVDDAIITSDGQVIHTHPDDTIYAFKGDVAINPLDGYGNTQGISQANTPNGGINYYSNSNYDLDGFSPYSEFSPVSA